MAANGAHRRTNLADRNLRRCPPYDL